MRANLDEEWVGLIWQHAVLPYLGEHSSAKKNDSRSSSLIGSASESPRIDDDEDDSFRCRTTP